MVISSIVKTVIHAFHKVADYIDTGADWLKKIERIQVIPNLIKSLVEIFRGIANSLDKIADAIGNIEFLICRLIALILNPFGYNIKCSHPKLLFKLSDNNKENKNASTQRD
jgi:hypothetical protein